MRALALVGDGILFAARPMNWALCRYHSSRVQAGSVLHISGMVHIPWLTVEILRRHGIRADYMAIGSSPHWEQCDFHVAYSSWAPVRAVQELVWFWKVVARYEIIHAHFMK